MPLDYTQDADFDLVIRDGDLVGGESTTQHQHDLLLAHPGEWRLYPTVGVGITRYFNDDLFGDLKSAVRRQFEADGMQIERLRLYEDGTMDIKADYP